MIKEYYRYGMKMRGVSIGTQPVKGLITWCDSEKYWDELIYNRKLSEKEIADYELEFIGVERRVNVD